MLDCDRILKRIEPTTLDRIELLLEGVVSCDPNEKGVRRFQQAYTAYQALLTEVKTAAPNYPNYEITLVIADRAYPIAIDNDEVISALFELLTVTMEYAFDEVNY
jgi:hypothetical protein